MNWLRPPFWLALLVLAVAWTGISRADSPAPPSTTVLNQQVKAGPLNITFTIDRSTVSVAQSVHAVLRVSVPTGVQVDLPSSEPKLGQFTVQSVVDEPQTAETDQAGLRSVFVRRYTLDPFLPGEYTLPPIDIRWRTTGTTESGIARTAPVKISVQSLLPADASKDKLDTGTIREAYTPPLKPDRTGLWVGFLLGMGVSLLAVGGVWYARRARGPGDVVADAIAAICEKQRSQFTLAETGTVCDLLSTALRNALADRVAPASRASLPDALRGQLVNSGCLSPQDSDETIAILKRLDEARFSGEQVSKSELDQLAERTLAILAFLKPIARVHSRKGVRA